MAEISVKVTKYAGRSNWLMYYLNPKTNKREWRSTGETKKREAERAAAKWEAELQEGRYKPASNVTWEEFRTRYEDEVAASLAKKTDAMLGTVFNAVERICNPVKLAALDATAISAFQTGLRDAKLAEATINTYLAHLKAALSWAVDQDLLAAMPKIRMPKRAKGSKMMKGRPITGEEFDRMLSKTEAGLLAAAMLNGRDTESNAQAVSLKPRRRFTDAVMVKHRAEQQARAAALAPAWQRFLQGLWLSGLRLAEALCLSWDDRRAICVDLAGRRPMLWIPAAMEKGNEDRLLPITPDFAAFLQAVPEAERTGPVFRLPGARSGASVNAEWVGRVISAIGRAAGIKVNTAGTLKFASAHDLRRSFGLRWSTKWMPATLQQMMRHKDISTTMKYYVGRNAEATADAIWEAAGVASAASTGQPINTFVNT